jgi:sigma-B regulation protein RsbU (phosphoserine phosphatase)
MDSTLISDSIVLLQAVSVIIVASLWVSRSRYFADVLDGRANNKDLAVLIIFFGAVSIYGSLIGVKVFGAIISVRDLGPLVGGLACGPIVGIGAGLIGGAFRFSEGGFTAIACSLAAILAGLFGGLVHLKTGKFPGVKFAVVFAVLFELLHMVLTLAFSRPFPLALEVVEQAVGPMVLANGVGMLIFAYIISNVIMERETEKERDTYQTELQKKQAELSVASDIQKSFLPEKIPLLDGFDIAATSIPAKEVGGDFYDFIAEDGRLGFVIADVSGKSISAALFMAYSRIIMRAAASSNEDASVALKDANNIIATDSGSRNSGMFVTLFFGILDPISRSLSYANAGHNPPQLFRANEGRFESMDVTGVALGMIGEMEYEERRIDLQPGDVLVLFTDGLVEAMDQNEQLFGLQRLTTSIRASTYLTAQQILDRILADISSFSRDLEQSDDITAIVIKAK